MNTPNLRMTIEKQDPPLPHAAPAESAMPWMWAMRPEEVGGEASGKGRRWQLGYFGKIFQRLEDLSSPTRTSSAQQGQAAGSRSSDFQRSTPVIRQSRPAHPTRSRASASVVRFCSRSCSDGAGGSMWRPCGCPTGGMPLGCSIPRPSHGDRHAEAGQNSAKSADCSCLWISLPRASFWQRDSTLLVLPLADLPGAESVDHGT